MKAIKAISAALLSLMTLSGVHAQEVYVKTQPHYKKKVVVKEHRHRYHSPSYHSHSEVNVNRHYGGYRRSYYYDKGKNRYYHVNNGRRVYYYHGWTPAY